MSYEEDFAGDIVGQLIASGAWDDPTFAGDIVGDFATGEDLEFGADLDALMTAAGAGPGARAPAFRSPAAARAALAKFAQSAAARARMQQAVRQRQIQGFNPTTYQFNPPDYTKARKVPMGFDSVTAIAPGATATITQRPQVPFRPARLLIPSDIAGGLLVLDFKVGNKSQLAANGGLPGRQFQEDATDSLLLLDTATPALDVTWIVQNISGAPFRFIGSASGPAVE